MAIVMTFVITNQVKRAVRNSTDHTKVLKIMYTGSY